MSSLIITGTKNQPCRVIMVVMVIYSVTLSYVKGERIEPVVQKYSVKKVFLKIHKIHRKTPMSEFLFFSGC